MRVDASIAVVLLEKFTSKLVITPDSEEGGVITPDFTTPVKGAKIKPASIFFGRVPGLAATGNPG